MDEFNFMENSNIIYFVTLFAFLMFLLITMCILSICFSRSPRIDIESISNETISMESIPLPTYQEVVNDQNKEIFQTTNEPVSYSTFLTKFFK